jgi:hypothetical protein
MAYGRTYNVGDPVKVTAHGVVFFPGIGVVVEAAPERDSLHGRDAEWDQAAGVCLASGARRECPADRGRELEELETFKIR